MRSQTLLRRASYFALLLACFCTSAAAAGGDDAPPAWLRQAAVTSAPAYDREVPGVVLYDEERISIGADGRIMRTVQYAVRILNRNGRNAARAIEHYETDSSKVREMRAWLIRSTGEIKRFGKDETSDVAVGGNDLYVESRARMISGVDQSDAGSVFGYEATTEEKSYFAQIEYGFQARSAFDGRLPVLVSRLVLTLPAGWTASSITFNHSNIEPSISGSTYTWELRNLAPIDPEPASPEVTNIAPRLAINYSSSSAASAGSRSFFKWTDVSRWYTELSDAQAAPNAAITAKARELTASARTEFEKIAAIGRYVQNLQYVSIQIGIGRFQPHTASEVFARSYGDCKDKAILMRSMLKAINLESYPVLIFSGDPAYVREEWASPTQFNHCIIAVKVSNETKAATVVQHATLGRLLIFDATDDNTPVGDLPSHEQNSFALIAAGDTGALLRMPQISPDDNHQERNIEVQLAADGSITAQVSERSTGQAAASERSMFRALPRPDYSKVIETWITEGAAGAVLSKIAPTDSMSQNRFALDVAFTAPHYGQVMNNSLLIFKPAVVSRRNLLPLTAAARKHPIILKAHAYSETARFVLPANFTVDETPDAVKIETSFGSYITSFEIKNDQLLFTRTLVVRDATIPVAQYATVRNFFERIRAAEQAPVVLAKK
ncbi:MAG: DUF3857 domain-containing transglutaminase family protein [Pyrinomonadaceae bacterium]|nr:DUF3857 domain-containing transglutaminase family protein [Pyrinomonadaceae bacterium]